MTSAQGSNIGPTGDHFEPCASILGSEDRDLPYFGVGIVCVEVVEYP